MYRSQKISIPDLGLQRFVRNHVVLGSGLDPCENERRKDLRRGTLLNPKYPVFLCSVLVRPRDPDLADVYRSDVSLNLCMSFTNASVSPFSLWTSSPRTRPILHVCRSDPGFGVPL